MHQAQQLATKPVENRKAYHTPKLEDYGDVRDLTQTSINIGEPADGGVIFPNMYTSLVG